MILFWWGVLAQEQPGYLAPFVINVVPYPTFNDGREVRKHMDHLRHWVIPQVHPSQQEDVVDPYPFTTTSEPEASNPIPDPIAGPLHELRCFTHSRHPPDWFVHTMGPINRLTSL